MAVRTSHRTRFQNVWSILPSVVLTVLVSWAGEVHAQTPTPAAPAPNAAPQNTRPQNTRPPRVAPPRPAPSATPQNEAPAEVLQSIRGIDSAASERNLEAVMAYYSPQFQSTDGLTFETMKNALKQFWSQYSTLSYKTELNTWQREGNAIVAETTTTITGSHDQNGRKLTLSSTIKSRQRLEAGKIVSQEILSERSQVSTGEKPPTIQVVLPDQVPAGGNFDFDAIVMEPLGDRLLLGAALEEAIQPSGYLNAAPITLELLNAGGLFKTGQAPASPQNRWVSAIIVRDDGITAVTQRLRITGAAGSASR